ICTSISLTSFSPWLAERVTLCSASSTECEGGKIRANVPALWRDVPAAPGVSNASLGSSAAILGGGAGVLIPGGGGRLRFVASIFGGAGVMMLGVCVFGFNGVGGGAVNFFGGGAGGG